MPEANVPANPSRLAHLDGLRGIAALVVACIFHLSAFSSKFQPNAAPLSSSPGYAFAPLHLLYEHGDLAVDLFFILSGYIFAFIYTSSIGDGRIGAREFLVRRIARLYPLHVATLVMAAIVGNVFLFLFGRFPVYTDNSPLAFVLNLFFLQHGTLEKAASFNGPSWSLSVEAYCYILFLWMASTRKVIPGSLLAIIVGLAMLGSGICRWETPMLLSPGVAHGLVGFFLGVLTCIGSRRGRPVTTSAFAVSVGIIGHSFRGWPDPHSLTWAVLPPLASCFRPRALRLQALGFETPEVAGGHITIRIPLPLPDPGVHPPRAFPGGLGSP